jgi:transposase
MRFVPIKTAEQQSVLSLHRARQGFVKARTAQANQIRGLLSEYGMVIPQGIGHVTKRLPQIVEDGENALPGQFRALLLRLSENLKEMDRQVGELEREIKAWHRQSEASRKLDQVPGIGPITASALVAEAMRAFNSAADGGMARSGSSAALHGREANVAGHQ